MSSVVFIDTETTSLDRVTGEIWEVALIPANDGPARRWFLPVDVGRADPVSLRIGGFHERHPQGLNYDRRPSDPMVTDKARFAREFAQMTQGQRHLAGAVISFDEERLAKLLKAAGQCPDWHYHLIDVEALAIGYLCGMDQITGHLEAGDLQLPWDSKALTRAVGLDPDAYEVHTAMGDALWARDMYMRVTTGR